MTDSFVSRKSCKLFDNSVKRNWLVGGRSVKGSMHVKSNIPNQDSIQWIQSQKSNSIILSVADGHGSNIHFRSKMGSHLATKTSIYTLDKFFNKQDVDYSNISQYKESIRFLLPRLMVRSWHDGVLNHYQKHPFSKNELYYLIKNNDTNLSNPENNIINTLYSDPKIAYGTTLLSVYLSKKFLFIFQIGDGDVLIVNRSGKVFSPLLNTFDSDSDKFALSLNQTASLCMKNSWLEFKTVIYSIDDIQPSLILLSTDGYSNSFSSFEHFNKIGIDYLSLFKNNGYSYVIENLSQILRETSINGSGDDITLGFLYLPL